MAASLSADDGPPEADRFENAPHPREASRLVGHAEAEANLLRACISGRLPQALLIGGPRGAGKATLAWRLARFLLANPDPEAAASALNLDVDEAHPAARQIRALAHPDLFLLRREWNEKTKKHFTDIRVEDVRRAIHMFQQAAGRGGYRVCIVDSAEDLNPSGANALLKLVEEPPPRSLFLIVAHRPGRVLATIRSRCRRINLKAPGPEEIARIVATLGPPWSEAGKADIGAAISRARGALHGVLRLIDGHGLEFAAALQRLFDQLPDVDWRAVHVLADQAAAARGGDYETLMSSVYDWIEGQVHDLAPTRGAGPTQLAPFAEVWEKVMDAAQQTEALNLDKRPFVFALFADLAAAAKAAKASVPSLGPPGRL